MKFLKNKKGFTLVELVVGTVILGMIGLTTAMLMTSGTNMYRGVHKRSTVLFKSQIAATQLTEMIVDCKYPFAVYDNTLFLGAQEDGKLVLKRFDFDATEHKLDLTIKKIGDDGEVSDEGKISMPFCYNVNDISYNVFTNEETNEAYAFRLLLTIEKFGLNYPRTDILSLRSHPVLVSGDNEDDTEQKLAQAVFSYHSKNSGN